MHHPSNQQKKQKNTIPQWCAQSVTYVFCNRTTFGPTGVSVQSHESVASAAFTAIMAKIASSVGAVATADSCKQARASAASARPPLRVSRKALLGGPT